MARACGKGMQGSGGSAGAASVLAAHAAGCCVMHGCAGKVCSGHATLRIGGVEPSSSSPAGLLRPGPAAAHLCAQLHQQRVYLLLLDAGLAAALAHIQQLSAGGRVLQHALHSRERMACSTSCASLTQLAVQHHDRCTTAAGLHVRQLSCEVLQPAAGLPAGLAWAGALRIATGCRARSTVTGRSFSTTGPASGA